MRTAKQGPGIQLHLRILVKVGWDICTNIDVVVSLNAHKKVRHLFRKQVFCFLVTQENFLSSNISSHTKEITHSYFFLCMCHFTSSKSLFSIQFIVARTSSLFLALFVLHFILIQNPLD